MGANIKSSIQEELENGEYIPNELDLLMLEILKEMLGLDDFESDEISDCVKPFLNYKRSNHVT